MVICDIMLHDQQQQQQQLQRGRALKSDAVGQIPSRKVLTDRLVCFHNINLPSHYLHSNISLQESCWEKFLPART